MAAKLGKDALHLLLQCVQTSFNIGFWHEWSSYPIISQTARCRQNGFCPVKIDCRRILSETPGYQPVGRYRIREPVADEVPFTEKEVRAAFESASYSNFSRFRRIVAVLDVRGEPMGLSEVEMCVTAWGSSQTDVQIQDFRQWTTPCVLVMDGGLLQIDRQSPNLFTMRRAVRNSRNAHYNERRSTSK